MKRITEKKMRLVACDFSMAPKKEEEKDALGYSPEENIPKISCFWLACGSPKGHQNTPEMLGHNFHYGLWESKIGFPTSLYGQ